MLAIPPEANVINLQPASYVYADALLREAVSVADQRNARMGHVIPCGPPDIYVYDKRHPDLVVAQGQFGSCGIWFSREFRDSSWDTYTDTHESIQTRRYAVAYLCALGVHERLHNAEFPHAPTGIMTKWRLPIPGSCARWSRRKLPSPQHQTHHQKRMEVTS